MINNKIIKENYYNLIKNIKYYRKQKGITQEELAEETDLSTSYIKQIEAGNEYKNMTLSTISKIAEALNIDIDELFKEKIG